MREKLNCPNCGAPIEHFKCPYCGTVILDFANIDINQPTYLRIRTPGTDQLMVVQAVPVQMALRQEPGKTVGLYCDNEIYRTMYQPGPCELDLHFVILPNKNGEFHINLKGE